MRSLIAFAANRLGYTEFAQRSGYLLSLKRASEALERGAVSKPSALGILDKTLARAMQRHQLPQERQAWEQIERIRTNLKKQTSTVEEMDFGAGSAVEQYSADAQRGGVKIVNRICEIVNYSKDPNWAEFLFHLVRVCRPEKVLEMGTCVGISGSYIAKGLQFNGKGRLWTLEGSPATAALAQQTFSKSGVSDQVTGVVGPFHQTLEACLIGDGPFDLVFVDGHHDGAATVQYFHQLKSQASKGALIVFDDIRWSDSMAGSWRTISSDADVLFSAEIGGMGFVGL